MKTIEAQQGTLPAPARPKPQARPSHRALWVALVIVGGLLAFGSVTYLAARSELAKLQQTGPVPIRYYLSIINKDYAQAARYVAPNATIAGRRVDGPAFIALATAAERRAGPVTGFVIDRDGGDAAGLTLTVYRGKRSYTVHMWLQRQGAMDRIIKADRL